MSRAGRFFRFASRARVDGMWPRFIASAGVAGALLTQPAWCATAALEKPGSTSQVKIKYESENGLLVPPVDSVKLREEFLQLKKDTPDFVQQGVPLKSMQGFLKQVGIEDSEVVASIFNAVDVDGSGKLEFGEIVAVMALVSTGTEEEQIRFLFDVLDLEASGHLTKRELRSVFRTLLVAQFRWTHRFWLDEPDEPDLYADFEQNELLGVAKLYANQVVSGIFEFADLDRDGVLSYKEFAFWFRRGGREVKLLKGLIKRATLGWVSVVGWHDWDGMGGKASKRAQWNQ